MRRHYTVYEARRRRRRALAVALPLIAAAVLSAVIVSTVAGGHDSTRRNSRLQVRVPARTAGWVPPPVTPVSAADRRGGLRSLIARGAGHSAAAGSAVGRSDGAVVRVAGRLGQRLGGDRGKP